MEFWRFSNPQIGDTADQFLESVDHFIKTTPLELPIRPGQGTREDGGLPPIVIRTDPVADPLRQGSIRVESAEALCYSDITCIIVHLKLNNFPVKCWFDQKILLNDQLFLSGNMLYSGDFQEFGYGVGCETPPLPATVQTLDVMFVPNVHQARTMHFDEIWGRTIVFRGIPITRRELGFSLTQWRVEQKQRDEMAAKIKAELEKPEP